MKRGAKFFLPVIALLIVAPMAPTFAGDAATPACVPVAGITPVITGTISNLKASNLNPDAGASVTLTFDVSLSAMPVNSEKYEVWISGSSDENGDSWTMDQWGNTAKLVFGDNQTGTWSATIAIPTTAVSGNYIIAPIAPFKTTTKIQPSLALTIKGVAPTPAAPFPTGIVTPRALTSSTIAAGTSFDYTFDVSLSSMPSRPVEYSVAVLPTEDENGEPWTTNVWDSRPAALVSGNNQQGTWKASISIPTWATTGTYNIIPSANTKILLTSAGILPGKKILIPITINGVAPVPIPIAPTPPTGSLTPHPLTSTTVSAGTSIIYTFDVSLSEMPTGPQSYMVYVGGSADENGDAWNSDGWSAPAVIVSGDNQRGTWSASIDIPSSAVSGTYQVGPIAKNKLVTQVGKSPTFTINGVPPCTTLPTPSATASPSGIKVYLDQVHPSGTDILSNDSAPLAYDKTVTGIPAAHIQIARGSATDKSQTIAVSINGPGLLSRSTNMSMASLVFWINEPTASIIDLYFFANGIAGVTTINITTNNATVTKQISTTSLYPAPTITPTPTPTQPDQVALQSQADEAKKSQELKNAEFLASVFFKARVTSAPFTYVPCGQSGGIKACTAPNPPAEISCPVGTYKIYAVVPPGTPGTGWEFRYCAAIANSSVFGSKSTVLQEAAKPIPLTLTEQKVLAVKLMEVPQLKRIPGSSFTYRTCTLSMNALSCALDSWGAAPEDISCPVANYKIDLILPSDYFKYEGFNTFVAPTMFGWEFKYCASGAPPFTPKTIVNPQTKSSPNPAATTTPLPRPSATPGAVATPLATSSAAKTSLKSITCIKGKSSKIVKAIKPTCPKGWTLKK